MKKPVFTTHAIRTACALALGASMMAPALAEVDLQFDITAAVPQPWYLGNTFPLTFTVTNNGNETSAGPSDTVDFSLPLETTATTLPADCAPTTGGTPPTQFITCEIPQLAPGASHSFAFQVEGIALYEPPGNGLDLRFSAIPTFVASDVGTGSPSTGAQQFFGGPFFIIPQLTAVPTMSVAGLALLGAAVGALGARRRKKQA